MTPKKTTTQLLFYTEDRKEQDSRLIDGPNKGWFQNNIQNGYTHNFRKDVDKDELRFGVIDQGIVTIMANGSWFTVNNTFLRVTHSTGYVCDYLYTFDSNGELFHNSFQEYERGDFRMFELYSNSTENFPASCLDNSCSSELPKGQDVSIFSMSGGNSTFEPAPCPAAGCE